VAVGGGKVVDRGYWLSLEEPSKWDDLEDPEHYIVNFMTRAPGYFQNKLAVHFAPGIGWQRSLLVAGRGTRHIQPISYWFRTMGEVVVLDPFEVIERPLISWYVERSPGP
jgi:hypothetical protein